MFTDLERGARIDRIECAELSGERLRSAGCNARRGVHGKTVPERIVKVSIGGSYGFGWSGITREAAEGLIGRTVEDIVAPRDKGLIRPDFRAIEFPLLDWLGKAVNRPVYELVGNTQHQDLSASFSVPSYDTSLYFDDLHLPDDADAVRLLQEEAAEGYANGHRNFKIKVGRCGRYMTLLDGLRRDIAIVQGIREFAGPEAHLMVDANNGFNLNLTKEFLAALADTGVYWLEEAFHEDDELYMDLKEWMQARGMRTLIADGEGQASPTLLEWARQGLVDVIQYDIRHYGFANWLELGARLDRMNVKSAPHNYGSGYGGYASGHLAAAIAGFQFVEWDPVRIDGIDGSAYSISDGMLHIPRLPGFGLQLDMDFFAQKAAENGWKV